MLNPSCGQTSTFLGDTEKMSLQKAMPPSSSGCASSSGPFPAASGAALPSVETGKDGCTNGWIYGILTWSRRLARYGLIVYKPLQTNKYIWGALSLGMASC